MPNEKLIRDLGISHPWCGFLYNLSHIELYICENYHVRKQILVKKVRHNNPTINIVNQLVGYHDVHI